MGLGNRRLVRARKRKKSAVVVPFNVFTGQNENFNIMLGVERLAFGFPDRPFWMMNGELHLDAPNEPTFTRFPRPHQGFVKNKIRTKVRKLYGFVVELNAVQTQELSEPKLFRAFI